MKNSKPKNTCRILSRSGEIEWSVILSVVTLILLFVLRKYLKTFIPLFFVLFVLVPMLWYLYRQYKYRDLWSVVPDYERLSGLLKRMRLHSYLQMIESSMNHLLTARDRAERIRDYLSGEDSEQVKKRIGDLEKQLKRADSAGRKDLLDKAITDATESLHNIERLSSYLARYEESKNLIAAHFKNAYIKIELGRIDAQSPAASENDEMERIMNEIHNFDFTYENVDRPSTERIRE